MVAKPRGRRPRGTGGLPGKGETFPFPDLKESSKDPAKLGLKKAGFQGQAWPARRPAWRASARALVFRPRRKTFVLEHSAFEKHQGTADRPQVRRISSASLGGHQDRPCLWRPVCRKRIVDPPIFAPTSTPRRGPVG